MSYKSQAACFATHTTSSLKHLSSRETGAATEGCVFPPCDRAGTEAFGARTAAHVPAVGSCSGLS